MAVNIIQPQKLTVNPGDKYGRLTILKEASPYIAPKGKKHRSFLCQCECGNQIQVALKSLRHGHTQSCGCLKKDIQRERRTTHGLSSHPLFWVWHYMKRRCEDPKNVAYLDYGGRGITVHKEWRNSAEVFAKWALANGWKKGLMIDRIDNDKGYCPENCRFVDTGLSLRNKRLLSVTNSSGHRGVSWDNVRQKWMVQIKSEGRRYCIGRYDDLDQAARAYDKKAKELNAGHPLNFPEKR